MNHEVQRINPPQLYDGKAHGLSHATYDPGSGIVYVSGQVAWGWASEVRADSYAEQSRLALQNLRTVLEASGSSLADVLHLRIYVRGEVEDCIEEVAPILAETFANHRPAVTGIGVASLASRETLVEIEAVARASGPT